MNKALLTTTALAAVCFFGAVSPSFAVLDGPKATATATATGEGGQGGQGGKGGNATAVQGQGQEQGQAQGQIQGQGQLQGQGQKQANDNRDSFSFTQNQDYEAAATSGSLGLGGNSFGAAVGECPTWGVGRGQAWGIGGSGGAVPGTGQGLFSRNTTEETFSPYCATVKAAATFRSNGQIAQAVALECTLPNMRDGYDAVDKETCKDRPVMNKVLIRTETETVASAYSTVPDPAPAVAKAPVVTPTQQPVAAAQPPAKPDYASCNGDLTCLNTVAKLQ
jgi:hypothetical protein